MMVTTQAPTLSALSDFRVLLDLVKLADDHGRVNELIDNLTKAREEADAATEALRVEGEKIAANRAALASDVADAKRTIAEAEQAERQRIDSLNAARDVDVKAQAILDSAQETLAEAQRIRDEANAAAADTRAAAAAALEDAKAEAARIIAQADDLRGEARAVLASARDAEDAALKKLEQMKAIVG